MTEAVENLPAPIDRLTTKLPATLNLDDHALARLAREVAMNIRELRDILADYKLNEVEYATFVERNPFYKRALDAAIIEWNSALSTAQRIKIEAAATLEDALPTLAGRMNNTDEDLGKAVETAKLFAKLAGLGESNAVGGGEKFTISINLGSDREIRIEKAEAPAGAEEVLDQPEGEGDGAPVQPKRKRARQISQV